MPRRKSPEEQEVADRLSTHRSNLAMYRAALIQYLDKVEMDHVELDAERVIFRSMTVTSKRLTRSVINGIIDAGLDVLTQAARAPLEQDIAAYMKAELKKQCDVVTYKGNLVKASSAEAKRVTREGMILRKGDASLVDAATRELCEAMWEELGHRHGLVEEGKAVKRARMEASQTSQATDAAPSPKGPRQEQPAQEPASPPSPQVASPGPPPAKPHSITAKAPRPKSSISKKQAAALFSVVAEYAVKHRRDKGLAKAVAQLVDGWWPAA